MNDMITALIVLLAAILIVNILNPEVRFWIYRLLARDKTDAIDRALATGKFPHEMQYKTVLLHGVYIAPVLGGKIYEHDRKTVVVEFTDEQIADWIGGIFSYPFWFGSRRIRLDKNFYRVLTVVRDQNKLKMFVARPERMSKTFKIVATTQAVVGAAVLAFLIHGAYRFNDPTMVVPAIYSATIGLIISSLHFFIRGSK